MNVRPDPTFHASPKLAMDAPVEDFAYTLLLSPDFLQPDVLAVIDVKPGSATYSQVVHTVTMPNKGDEFHHFGWNACSSALSPLTGHAFLERRYLIIPGMRSSRLYIVDTKPHPTQARIYKIIEPRQLGIHAGIPIPILRLGDEEPGVVGVFGPVEREADRTGRTGMGDADADVAADGAMPTDSTRPRPWTRPMRVASRPGPGCTRRREEQGAEEGRAQARMPAGALTDKVIDDLQSRETGTPPPGAGDGVIDDVRPASFAGTSRIRFGGSVADHTLSASALPGGICS